MNSIDQRRSRIIMLLLVMAALMIGLISPSSCDESYNSLLHMNHAHQEIHTLDSRALHDCVIENASGHHQMPMLSDKRALRSAGALSIIIRHESDSVYSGIHRNSGFFNYFYLALLGISVYASLQILYIHCKDGHK